MTDIEIARAAKLLPVSEIGRRLGIPADGILPYGHTKAKVSADFLAGLADLQAVLVIQRGGLRAVPD